MMNQILICNVQGFADPLQEQIGSHWLSKHCATLQNFCLQEFQVELQLHTDAKRPICIGLQLKKEDW